jgi:hypothetical protein
MDTQQFQAEFAKLFASFPLFRSEDKRRLAAMWFETLHRFDVQIMRLARRAVIESGREFFPTLPEFLADCNV